MDEYHEYRRRIESSFVFSCWLKLYEVDTLFVYVTVSNTKYNLGKTRSSTFQKFECIAHRVKIFMSDHRSTLSSTKIILFLEWTNTIYT